MDKEVCIIGAGTMGRGIAQVAATSGWKTNLYDKNHNLCLNAAESVKKRIDRLAEKGLVNEKNHLIYKSNINVSEDLSTYKNSSLVIEAIVEDFNLKVELLNLLKKKFPNSILGTNTSSLSITDLANKSNTADQLIGIHFFNPAPLMPLVEIIKGDETPSDILEKTNNIITEWSKVAVCAKDAPGFIVNRVARPFYLESWRCFENSLGGIDSIDYSMTEVAGFKMGPFTLTDLIGQDINVATTQSIFSRLNKPSRLTPNWIQEELVYNGFLGKKSSRGAYAYSKSEKIPALFEQPNKATLPLAESKIVDQFSKNAGFKKDTPIHSLIASRVLACIINEAWWAKEEDVASELEIDTAMKLGTGYPYGPFEWCKKIGPNIVKTLLASMSESVSDDRYKSPS